MRILDAGACRRRHQRHRAASVQAAGGRLPACWLKGVLHRLKHQEAGWPIGSGSVESANKLVVEARLKGAGMRWGRHNVNPMLVLRNAVCNREWKHTWETAWTHRQGLRTQGRSS